MDNIKLVTILLNDISELEELIVEIRRNQHYEPIDMEFLHTRTKGVRKIVEMLVQNLGQEEERKTVSEAVRKLADVEPEVLSAELITETEKEKPVSFSVKEETEEKVKVPEQSSSGKEELNEQEMAVQQEIKSPEEVDQEIGFVEEPVKEEPKILGEKFSKEKSLNELLSDQSSLESKLTNRPISNLQLAIGVNDRFLYIRELFAGDSKMFDEVVKKLDSLTSLNGAIEFLKEHFQWKKNETSQKFLSLVKRRYADA